MFTNLTNSLLHHNTSLTTEERITLLTAIEDKVTDLYNQSRLVTMNHINTLSDNLLVRFYNDFDDNSKSKILNSLQQGMKHE